MTTTETRAAPLGEFELLAEAERDMPVGYRKVLQGLRILDGQCDGAATRDRLGFSRVHREAGTDFARMYRSRGYHLTAAQYAYAYRIISTYSRQLAEYGLTVPTIAESNIAQAHLAEIDRERRAQREAEALRLVEQASTPAPREQQAAAPTACTLSLDGESTIKITFPYNKTLVGRMHELRAKRDTLALKKKNIGLVRFEQIGGVHWQAPIELLTDVVAAFPGFARDEEIEHRLRTAAEEAEAAARAAEEKATRERERMIALAAALGKLSAPQPNGRVLYKHQRETIVQLAKWGAGILAHEMGLGKTLQAVVLAKAYHQAFGARVVVIGPLGLRTNWIREAAEIGLTSIEYYTYEKIPSPEDIHNSLWGDVPYVLFADEAHAFQNMTAQRTKKFIALAWSAMCCVPMTGTPAKNGRPINMYPLLLACKHELVYKEKPDGSPDTAEIAELKKDYMRRYCVSDAPPVTLADGRQIFDRNGAMRLDELYKLTARTPRGVLRKRKAECLDLPKKVRKFAPVELSTEQIAAYDTDLDSMWATYQARVDARVDAWKRDKWEEAAQERLAAVIEEYGAPESEEKLTTLYEDIRRDVLDEAIEQANAGEALVELNNLRQAGSRAKLTPTIAFIKDEIERDALEAAEAEVEGRKHKPAAFVVFSAFIATAKAVAAAFAPASALITGETKIADRDKAVDDFQAGKLRVVSCIYGAGGVGITLTAGTHVILLDRPWTPGDAEQAEDRLHRIGLEEDILALWVQLPESVTDIDTKIDGILLQKQERAIKMLDGNLDDLPPDILFKNIARDLLDGAMRRRRGAQHTEKAVANHDKK